MSRIVTIHPAKEIHRYGFEATQVYRARIARHLGLEYVHLVSSPQLRPDWKKDLIKLGFLEKELLCVPHIFSDIGHADLTVRPESLTLADGDQVELNEDGFVASVTLGDGSGRYYYTKGPFLFEDFREKELHWYHENGELALEGRFIDPFKEPSPVTIFYPEYIYRIEGEICSEEDLLVKFLARWAQQTDLFIRDQQIVPKPSLWRYMENTDKNYYEVVHENIMRDLRLANLRKANRYLVASEKLTESLAKEGYQTRFLPPMFTEDPGQIKELGPVLVPRPASPFMVEQRNVWRSCAIATICHQPFSSKALSTKFLTISTSATCLLVLQNYLPTPALKPSIRVCLPRYQMWSLPIVSMPNSQMLSAFSEIRHN